LDLAGETALKLHPLVASLTLTLLFLQVGDARAQSAFPAPLPGQPARPPANDPAFPPVNGAAPAATIGAPPTSSFPVNGAAPIGGGPSASPFGGPPAGPTGGPSEACMKSFIPLREEAEKRGKLIKAASDRHAPPDEACKLIGNYSQAEFKMMKYVEANAAKCGIPPQVPDQLKAGHKNTEALLDKVCNVAKQVKARGGGGPTLSEVLGSSAAVPEVTPAKKGGSTFDTLNGNALAR
jgi:hypothetical protein